MQTWEKCEHHRHPAHYVGPGEPPAAIAFPVVVHGHAGVDGHRQQHEEACRETSQNSGPFQDGGCGCQLLTGDEEEDPGCKGLVEAVKGGVVDEGHDADQDAEETGQQGQDHEGPGGVPVGWDRDRTGVRTFLNSDVKIFSTPKYTSFSVTFHFQQIYNFEFSECLSQLVNSCSKCTKQTTTKKLQPYYRISLILTI